MRLYVGVSVLLTLGVSACGDPADALDSSFMPPSSDGGVVCTPNRETMGSEVCNGLDDDCDGFTDEAPSGSPLRRPCESACGGGTESCVSGAWVSCNAPQPTPEVCNGLDDDCNDTPDDGLSCECTSGDTRACGTNEGRCTAGLQQCLDGQWQTSCFGAVGPEDQETCNNGIDDDCNGRIDEGCECRAGETQPCGIDEGVCRAGQITCQANGRWGTACEGEVRPTAEQCNGLDDDCDGEADWNRATNVGWRSDPNEPSDTCGGAVGLPDAVDSAGWVSVPVADPNDISTYPTLHPPGMDEDWFRFRAEEISHGACVPLTSQCAFVLVLQLSLERGVDPRDYELCLSTVDRCSEVSEDTEVCTTGDQWVAASDAYVLGVKWGGTCGRDDSRNVFARVRSPSGRAACGYYQLSARFYYDENETCP